MHKFILLLSFVVFNVFSASAQVVSTQNQFVVNPFIYNPAWAGSSNYMQFHAGFKKQWLGIDGSPSISTLTFEMPLPGSFNLSANLINVTQGPWNYLNSQFGAAYQLPLGYGENHFLRFGMMLGFRYGNFNINQLSDPNDPALVGVKQSNFTPDGSFGLAYQYQNLQLGVSMPRFSQTYPTSSEIKINPWHHLIASAAYRFDIGISDWAITPTVVYHREQGFDDQWEGIVKVTYLDKFWGGGNYRQDYGTTAFVGAEINQTFSLNYFYTFGNLSSPVPNQSHELTLRIRIGGNRRDTAPSKNQEIEDENENEEKTTETKTNPKKDTTSSSLTSIPGPKPKADPDENNPIFKVAPDVNLNSYDKSLEVHYVFSPDKIIGRTQTGYAFDLEKGNYISMGKFKYSADAEPILKEMQAKGLNPRLIYVRSEKVYYVYILQKPDLDRSRKIILSLRKLKGFEKAHLVVLD